MPEEHQETESRLAMRRRVLRSLGLAVWVVASFYAANLLIGLVLSLLVQVNLINPSTALEGPVFMATLAAVVFLLTFVLVVGIPYAVKGSRVSREELGLKRLPDWYDFFWAPVSFVIYMIIAGVLMVVVTKLVPGFNADETQDIGFEDLDAYYEYILAFITLVVIAPIAEETLFRGYLYGKLRKYIPMIGAVLLSSVVFALLHLSFGIDSETGHFTINQWNVALNVLPLAIILALLREKTGSIWSGILLHAIKNGVAFYLLFINPSVLDTIVK